MTFDYAIDAAAERIIDRRTREYFKEVNGCYHAGYLRSAMVMLWSVVVCDLLYKLDQLANASGDTIAKGILSEIEADRKNSPDSPKWEEKLLNLITDRTEFFDASTALTLRTLQKYRHLSAHPILTENDVLFSPSHEIVRAHLRVALEEVLTRPAAMSRKVFNAFMSDLEVHSSVLPDEDSVKTYISTKYVPHFTEGTESDLFRRLWRIVFRVTDEQCEANRRLNLLALVVLFDRKRETRIENIRSDSSYYSDCQFAGSTLQHLVAFLRRNPDVFCLLNAAAHSTIRNHVSATLDDYCTACYLSESPESHAKIVKHRISEGESLSISGFKRFLRQAKTFGLSNYAVFVAIEQYSRAKHFSEADLLFRELIRPVMNDFQLSDFVGFLKKCELNRQTYKRGTDDHIEVRQILDSKFLGKINLQEFPNMERSMRPAEESLKDVPSFIPQPASESGTR